MVDDYPKLLTDMQGVFDPHFSQITSKVHGVSIPLRKNKSMQKIKPSSRHKYEAEFVITRKIGMYTIIIPQSKILNIFKPTDSNRKIES